jgi:hypothetical protein
MPPVGFEPTISAGERPQTDVVDRAATGSGSILITELNSYVAFCTNYMISVIILDDQNSGFF